MSSTPATFERVGIDQVRAFWDRRPCNIRHSPEPVGTRAYFEQVRDRKYFIEPHIPVFADFPAWEGKRVLEIGCGIGTDTISFAQQGARVTAVDLSPRSLEIAEQRASVYGLDERITFHQGDAETLAGTIPTEPYDLVYSFGVLHHTPNPARAVAQLEAFTRPGSVVKLMLYHRRSTKAMGLAAGRWLRGDLRSMDELVARQSEAQSGCPVTYTYTRQTGRALLESHGYRVTECFVEHVFPYRIADYVRYRYVKAWPWRAVPTAMFRAIERRLGWHLCLTAKAPRESG